MTCVWDSLLRALRPEEKALLGGPNCPGTLVAALKNTVENDGSFKGVAVNGLRVSIQQWKEAADAIRSISHERTFSGYDFSAFEPVLCVLSSRLGWRVHHNFAGHLIQYVPDKEERSINFSSTSSHFM